MSQSPRLHIVTRDAYIAGEPPNRATVSLDDQYLGLDGGPGRRTFMWRDEASGRLGTATYRIIRLASGNNALELALEVLAEWDS